MKSPTLGAKGWVAVVLLGALIGFVSGTDLPRWADLLIIALVVLVPVDMLRVDAIDRARLTGRL